MKVVRLDSLTPDMRRVVLALIDAQQSACASGRHVMQGDHCKYQTSHRQKERE